MGGNRKILSQKLVLAMAKRLRKKCGFRFTYCVNNLGIGLFKNVNWFDFETLPDGIENLDNQIDS